MADLSVEIKGLRLKNPVMTASGTFGYGPEFADFVPLEGIGGIIVKGTTLKPRQGNDYPRMVETASGMLNPVERKLLRAGAVSMTSEVAVRFFTDYLEGDHYFHTAYPGHNLVRAKSQLALARSILGELPAE